MHLRMYKHDEKAHGRAVSVYSGCKLPLLCLLITNRRSDPPAFMRMCVFMSIEGVQSVLYPVLYDFDPSTCLGLNHNNNNNNNNKSIQSILHLSPKAGHVSTPSDAKRAS